MIALALSYGDQGSLRSEEKLTLSDLPSTVYAVGFSDDGRLAVTGTPLMITVWDARTGKWQYRLRAPKGAFAIGWGVLLLPDNERVLAAGGGKYIRIWVMDTDIPEAEIPLDVPKDSGVQAIALSPDGGTLAAGTMMNVIHLIDMKTKKVTDVLNVHKEGKRYKHSLTFSPDGKRLASAGGGANETVVLDMQTKKTLYRVTGFRDGEVMSYVGWSRDGKLLATTSSRYISFWDGANGDFISQLGPVPGFVDGLAFSPTDDLLAIAATDSILYYRTEKMEPIAAEQHKGVSCLAFSRDGKLLITGSKDRFEKNAKIWKVPTR